MNDDNFEPRKVVTFRMLKQHHKDLKDIKKNTDSEYNIGWMINDAINNWVKNNKHLLGR